MVKRQLDACGAVVGTWLARAAAGSASPGPASFHHRPARDPERDHAVQPPGAPQRVGGQPGEHRRGQVGAQQVLASLSRGGRGAQPGADPPLGHPESGLENGRSRSEHEPDNAGLGPVPGRQRPDRIDRDVRREQEEADRDQLLGAPSDVGLASRVPVNRQMTMMDAIASMPLSRPKPSRATDPATTAAAIATPPSMPIQARVIHDSVRARRASRSQSAGTGTCTVASHWSASADT